MAGAVRGVLAGCTQSVLGDNIPDRIGYKLHSVQLGIITIVLSLVSLIWVITLMVIATA